MQIKLLVSAAAIALATGLGSASAAEQFATLGPDILAEALQVDEMQEVRGMDVFLNAQNPNPGVAIDNTDFEATSTNAPWEQSFGFNNGVNTFTEFHIIATYDATLDNNPIGVFETCIPTCPQLP